MSLFYVYPFKCQLCGERFRSFQRGVRYIRVEEDRREYDPQLVAEWAKHPNALHRVRIALALGRIGPHTFADADGDGALDPEEAQAGVAELIAMAADGDRNVREMVAFALGEIGDPKAIPALEAALRDPDPDVRKLTQLALKQILSAAPH